MQTGCDVALPGFEQLVESKAETDKRDVGADLRARNFTAERLAVEYPGKYALAARAFFKKSRSAESISDILQISPQTMHAIIERECAARGIFDLKEHIKVKATSAAHKAVIKLHELLDDEDAVRKAGITGLVSAIRALTADVENTPQKPENPGASSEEPNEYLEMVESDGTYGFEREKISAPLEANLNECGAQPRNENATPKADSSPIQKTGNNGKVHNE